MANQLRRFYPETQFGNFSDVSGTMRFYVRVRALLEPEFTVLDVGCGRGSYAAKLSPFERSLRVFKGQAKHVIGIDVDPVGETNPCIDEFRLINGPRWPVENGTINLVVSDWTMEHVEAPQAFLEECHRVLTPGGYLCMRTSNRLGYIAVISSLIPNRSHIKVLGKAQPERNSKDVFPTVYRCNTIGKLRRALSNLNFQHCVFGHEAEPAYLNFSGLAYALGVAYQKMVPKALGSTLYVFARKK